MQLFAILSGLAAALSWGAGDFAGGLASRRAPAIRVVVTSQGVGLFALVVLGILLREPRPSAGDALLGALAGLAGGVGLLLLYLSLARGKMGVAAPLTAVASGGVPLLAGVASEGLPGTAQSAGFLLALAAIWVIARSDEAGDFRPRDAVLPLLAGVGFGAFLAIIGRVGEGVDFIWPLVAARVASVTMLGVVAPGATHFLKWVAPDPLTTDPLNTGFPLALAVLAGLGDTAGNAFFVLSAATGRLDVAAVLGALYPAATVVLAWLVLGERLSVRQSAGVGLALAAVALIAL